MPLCLVSFIGKHLAETLNVEMCNNRIQRNSCIQRNSLIRDRVSGDHFRLPLIFFWSAWFRVEGGGVHRMDG